MEGVNNGEVKKSDIEIRKDMLKVKEVEILKWCGTPTLNRSFSTEVDNVGNMLGDMGHQKVIWEGFSRQVASYLKEKKLSDFQFILKFLDDDCIEVTPLQETGEKLATEKFYFRNGKLEEAY